MQNGGGVWTEWSFTEPGMGGGGGFSEPPAGASDPLPLCALPLEAALMNELASEPLASSPPSLWRWRLLRGWGEQARELDPAGMHGLNIIPGGQHADPGSAYFADQAELWLANEASEIRFYVDDVVANAIGREVLSP